MSRVAIVAGGRHYIMKDGDLDLLKMYFFKYGIDTVYSGHCLTGADPIGEQAAIECDLHLFCYPADWTHLGLKAGPVRNNAMAEKAVKVSKDGQPICILFPGGSGTISMERCAISHGLMVIHV
jgi:hypothetical protein